jgi:hypothetical protein
VAIPVTAPAGFVVVCILTASCDPRRFVVLCVSFDRVCEPVLAVTAGEDGAFLLTWCRATCAAGTRVAVAAALATTCAIGASLADVVGAAFFTGVSDRLGTETALASRP